ncbi:MAG TPA: hypothetical protein VGL91_19105 [Acidobacteriota bacterium]
MPLYSKDGFVNGPQQLPICLAEAQAYVGVMILIGLVSKVACAEMSRAKGWGFLPQYFRFFFE